MPDSERMLERVVEGLALLTQQVARLSYAAEAAVLMQVAPDSSLKICRACQSRIQAADNVHCKACGEYIKDG